MNSYITKTSLTKKKKGGGFKERKREGKRAETIRSIFTKEIK